MATNSDRGRSLAAAITRASSKQTYYTFRFLADRDQVDDAYRAYAYFRWVDDILDSEQGTRAEKLAFINRQRTLLEDLYRGAQPQSLTDEENMLLEMVRNDDGHGGMRSYLDNMMAVMEFDVQRRGRLISQAELDAYTHKLTVAVTDLMFYAIGHDDPAPTQSGRYLAVSAAHITHMLRDTCEDIQAGYYNVSREFLTQHNLDIADIDHPAYRQWLQKRVALARENFRVGLEYIAQVKNLRCRLAGFAYAARFEWVLDAIERDGYRLRPNYDQRKSLGALLQIVWSALTGLLASILTVHKPKLLIEQSIRIEKSWTPKP